MPMKDCHAVLRYIDNPCFFLMIRRDRRCALFSLVALAHLLACSTEAAAVSTTAVTLNFVGDLAFQYLSPSRKWVSPYVDPALSPEIRLILQNGWTFGNLETSVVSHESLHDVPPKTTDTTATPKGVFVATPENITTLADNGFNALTICNNHWYDTGEVGSARTAKILSAAGIRPLCQASSKNTNAVKVESIEIGDEKWRIGLIASNVAIDTPEPCDNYKTSTFSHRPSCIASHRSASGDKGKPREWKYNHTSIEQLLDAVSKSVSTHDMTVVSLHWGKQFQEKVSPAQRRLGQNIVRAGAKLVVGHHPHVVHGMEIVENINSTGRGLIAYSLSSFLWPFASQSVIMQVTVDFKAVSSTGRTGGKMLHHSHDHGRNKSTPALPTEKILTMRVCMIPTLMKGGQLVVSSSDIQNVMLRKIAKLSSFLSDQYQTNTDQFVKDGCISV